MIRLIHEFIEKGGLFVVNMDVQGGLVCDSDIYDE